MGSKYVQGQTACVLRDEKINTVCRMVDGKVKEGKEGLRIVFAVSPSGPSHSASAHYKPFLRLSVQYLHNW
jgi:hypothetical protein